MALTIELAQLLRCFYAEEAAPLVAIGTRPLTHCTGLHVDTNYKTTLNKREIRNSHKIRGVKWSRSSINQGHGQLSTQQKMRTKHCNKAKNIHTY